jgi:D-aspartate ligase
MPVWVVLSDEHRVACFSRFVGRSLSWPRTADERVDWLLDLGAREELEGWVLFPTDDETMALIARAEGRLGRVYRVASSPWATTRVAYDKRETYERAARLGLAQPWTAFPADRADVAHLDCTFPAIIKPCIKPVANSLTAAKAWRVEDREDLLRKYDAATALMDPGLLMVQELIPGRGAHQLSFAALCRDGEIVAKVGARRLRQRPMDLGVASTYVETAHEPEAEAAARRLLSDLRFTGIVEVEFKRDPRDDIPKLLDINARIWGWHTLCERAGVNFPALWCDLLRGREVQPVEGRIGVRWVRMATDVPTVMREIAMGRLGLGAYLASLRAPLAHAILASDDFLPVFVDVPILAGISLRRRRADISTRQAGRALPEQADTAVAS